MVRSELTVCPSAPEHVLAQMSGMSDVDNGVIVLAGLVRCTWRRRRALLAEDFEGSIGLDGEPRALLIFVRVIS